MARRYTMFWDFVLLSMSFVAWPLALLMRGPLVREAGAPTWPFVAMWPLGAALLPLVLIALVELGRTRHRSFTIAMCVLSLLGMIGLLSIIHVGNVRETLIADDLDQGGGAGFAYDRVSEHLESHPIIGKKILRSPKLSQKLMSEVDREFDGDPTGGNWSKRMTHAVWAAAAQRAQNKPLQELLALQHGPEVVAALLAAEARPDPAWKWLGKVATLAPSGSFQLGLITPADGSALAKAALGRAEGKPHVLNALILASALHPGLLDQAELDRLLELQRAQIGATPGTAKGAAFDRVQALRGELGRKLAGRSTVGLDMSVVNPKEIDELRVYAKESMRGLFHCAGFQTTTGKDVKVKIALRRVKYAAAKRYDDSWVFGFDLNDGNGNPPMPSISELTKSADAGTDGGRLGSLGDAGFTLDAGSAAPADAGSAAPADAAATDAGAPPAELVNARQPIELPVLIEEGSKQGWLFGVPPFYFDVMPKEIYTKLRGS